MSNIHILPTDKPSRLFIDIDDNKLKITIPIGGEHMMNQNIYITSDEYIGLSYYLDGSLVRKGVVDDKDYWEARKDYKKIILTTDLDLIKDGVQTIPDEFLEWFVKNPSCEEVEVVKDRVFRLDEFNQREFYNQYKIIIPKEELKQDRTCTNNCSVVCGECQILQLKQGTLEEAAERIYREYPNNPLNKPEWHYNRDINCFKKRKAFILGAKYQADKMYSEEEVIELLEYTRKNFYDTGTKWHSEPDTDYTSKELFQQFKKK